MAFSSSDSEEDESWFHLKRHIHERIFDVRSAGSFATSGSFENFVLPGIAVDGVGEIRLPLSPVDARALIRASRRAPFGKGSQTLIDERVRRTWEVDGSKVSFSNNAWHGWLDGVVKAVTKELGVASDTDNSVRAELYKMLLYEEGAMFKPHKDTEKTPGMFGTLVICLPSKHLGGAVRLAHGQKEKCFATAEPSAYGTTYIAWYADVNHEIEPIKSGYRWVLTYNLVNTHSSSLPKCAGELDAQIARFCQALAEWRGLGKDGPQCLCHALDHQYTDAALKLANFKGHDYFRVRYVVDSCEEAGDFCVLLASLEKVVTFLNDEGGEEEAESTLRIKRITDIEGFVLRDELQLPEDFLLQEELYDSRDPDDQTGGEYMGNQHAEFDQFYNDTVMIILRKTSVTDFLLGRSPTLAHFENLLQRLRTCFRMRHNDPHIRYLIDQACQNVLKRLAADPGGEKKDWFLSPIAVAAMAIADKGLFRDAVRSITNSFDVGTYLTFGELICFQAPAVMEDDLIEAFSRIPKLHRLRQCLCAFRNGFSGNNVNHSDEHQAQYLESWVRDRTLKALKSLQEAHPQDAGALIETAKEFDDKMFEEGVKPFIARFAEGSDFSNALAVEILSFSQGPSHDKDLAARFFPLVLGPAASQFELQKYSSASKRNSDYPYSSWPHCYGDQEKGKHDASIVVGLYQQLFKSDPKKASDLLDKIQLQTESLPHTELSRLVIPLLEQLMHVVDRRSPNVRQFYQSTMAIYITQVVKAEPEKPRDWSRPNECKKCWNGDCSVCQSVHEFLMDAHQESRTFVSSSEQDFWHLRGTSALAQCKKSADESLKPPVLLVTKTLEEWEKNHGEWQKRASQAQQAFKRFAQAELKECLAEKYDVTMDLRIVKIEDKGSLVQTTDDRLESIVPQKRPR